METENKVDNQEQEQVKVGQVLFLEKACGTKRETAATRQLKNTV